MDYDDIIELVLMNTGHRVEFLGTELFKHYFYILSELQEANEEYAESEEYEELVQSFPCLGSNSKYRNKMKVYDEADNYDFSDTLNDYALLEPQKASNFWQYVEKLPNDICNNTILYEKDQSKEPVEERNVKKTRKTLGRKTGKKAPAYIPVPVIEERKKMKAGGKNFFIDNSIMLQEYFTYEIKKVDSTHWNFMSEYKNGFTELCCKMNAIQREFMVRNRLSDDPIIYSALLAELEMKESERLNHFEALLNRMDKYNAGKEALKKEKQAWLQKNQVTFTREAAIKYKKWLCIKALQRAHKKALKEWIDKEKEE